MKKINLSEVSRNLRSIMRLVPSYLKMEKPPKELLVDSLREAESNSVIEPDTVAMMEGALLVSDMRVRDIMIPRSEIVFIEEDSKPSKILSKIIVSCF